MPRWSKLPKEDIIYISRDSWVSNNPKTLNGTMYIENETQKCKIGDGKRYNSIPYTPWSIFSAGSSSIIKVQSIVSSTSSLNTTLQYIWGGDSTYISGYILSFLNGVWNAAIPNENSIAWITETEDLLFWDGIRWTEVSGAGSFFALSDVVVSNPLAGDVFVLNTSGQLENKQINDLVDTSRFLLIPTVEVSNENHVIFSDGKGGTFTNGIKTDEYDRLDMNMNYIKNAIIDCGTYYD